MNEKIRNFVDARIRVRYAETDQMGYAYYSNYLVWFEVARTTYCREKGLVYADLERTAETFLPVVDVRCRYHRPARYDDDLVVRTRVTESRKRTLTFAYQVLSRGDETLLAEGSTKHVYTDRNGRPRSLPEEYRQYLKAEL